MPAASLVFAFPNRSRHDFSIDYLMGETDGIEGSREGMHEVRAECGVEKPGEFEVETFDEEVTGGNLDWGAKRKLIEL